MPFDSFVARRVQAVVMASVALIGAVLFAVINPSQSKATPAVSWTCMANPLGAATGYNEFILGNGSRGSESEGAIAYGGTLSASSMTVGSRLSTTNKSFPALVVAGGTSAGFNLQAGSAYLDGRTSGVNFNGGGSYLASDPINFTSAFQSLQANATSWAAITPNGMTEVIAPGADGTPAMGGSSSLLMTGTDPTVDVFDVTPAELSGSAAIFVNVPTGATALINVSGSGAVTISGTLEFWNGSSYGQPDNFSEGSGVSNQVTDTVWNFPATTTVNLSNGDAFGGTILAPQATVNAVSIGHNNGAVIAAAFNSNFETHNYLLPSSACLPATTQTTTPPPPPAQAELHVSKSASASSVQAGQDVTYTVGVTNAGQGAAANVALADTLPAGMTFVSADSGCTDAGQTVTCTAGTLASGASATFHIVARADQVSSPANTSDQLTVVKAEQYITMQAGQTVTTNLACPSGMFATDASVEPVHVDQGTGTLESVQVNGLYQLTDGSYQAVVTNTSSGQAQAEMYATCMSNQTQQGYPLEVTGETSQASTLTAGTHTIALNCGAGRTPVAPSFDVTSGNAAETALVPNGTSEQDLSLQVGTGGAQVVVGMRCLEDETGIHNGSVEQLGFTQVNRTVTVPAGTETSTQVSCGDLQKGIVGGWNLQPGLNSMGSEPQPKIRLFWIDNPSSQALTGQLSLLCVNEYLGQATGVAQLTNTVTGSTTSAQDSGAVLSASATVTVSGGQAAAGTPTITIDPQSAGLVSHVSNCAVRLNARGQLHVTLKLTGATSGTVALQTPRPVHSGSVKLKAGTRLSHARVKTRQAGTRTITLTVGRNVRRALHALHRTRLTLVVHAHGHTARVALKLQNA
jgi:choice-of-anchor A domain-containing protein/uncharacterized repeat protein (TIGR01451 family)